jgi:hypothetical protein
VPIYEFQCPKCWDESEQLVPLTSSGKRAAYALTDALSPVAPQQLDELGLELSPKVKARLAEPPAG